MSENFDPFRRVPFAELVLEKNPRPASSISAESIEDMASSILQHGIIQPLPARLVDGVVKPFIGQRRMLGFGRARERAANGEAAAAGVDLEKVPVLIEEISDREMLEKQCVENLQRENVHPRDESLGYRAMRDELGYTIDKIAETIGKKRTYVVGRLAMVAIPDLAWRAYDEGRLTISHIELIGSVKNALDREEFTKLVLGGKYGDKVMSVKDAAEARANRFVITLTGCGFKRNDATLVPIQWVDGQRVMGGACDDECPFKVGSEKVPMCENLRCFRAKQDALWKLVQDNAERLGRRTMNKDRSSEVFANDGDGELLEASGLIDLGGKLRYMDTGHHSDDTPTWESLGLGQGSEAMAAAIVARHPKTNRVHHLLEREEAIRLAIEVDEAHAKLFANRPGVKKAVPAQTDDDADDDDHDEVVPVEEQQETETVVPVAETKKTAESLSFYAVEVEAFFAHAKGGTDVDAVLSMVFEAAVNAMSLDAMRVALAAMGGEVLDGSAEWSRDACQRMLCAASPDIDLRLFTVLVTTLRMRGHRELTAALQQLLNLDFPKLEQEAPQPVETVQDKAWKLFVEGKGKGTIGKELGISENAVGTWQKRHWPSRDEVKRYLEAHKGDESSNLALDVVKAWLEKNPVK